MSLNIQPLSDTLIALPRNTGLSSSLTNIALDADNGNSSLVVQTGGTPSLYIDKFGNTGINTTSPGCQLEIASNNGSCLRLRYGNTPLSAFADLFITSNGNLLINPNTSGSKIATTASLDLTNHNGSTSGLKLAGALVTASAHQINYIDVTKGEATASKALVLDTLKSISGINSLGVSTISLSGDTIRSSSTILNISANSQSSTGNIYIDGSTSQYGFNTQTFQPGYQFTLNASTTNSGIYATGKNSLIYLKNNSESGDAGSTSIRFNSDSGSMLEMGQSNSGSSIVPNGFYIFNSNYLMTLGITGILTLPRSTSMLNIGTSTEGFGSDKKVVICNNTISPDTRQGIFIGHSLEDFNSAYFSHYYIASKSFGNRIGIGFCGADDIVTVMPTGRLGIGNTNPVAPLQVSGYTSASIGSPENNTYALTNAGYGVLTGSTTLNIGMKVDYGVHVGSVGVYVTSDRRVKTNIKSINKNAALDFILKTEPRTYQLKEDNSMQIGYIAQELRSSAFGPLISFGFKKNEFPSESPDDVDNTILVAQYERICCILHKGLQDALWRIEALEQLIQSKMK